MALGLHNLKFNKSAKKKRKRVGRGNASGHGNYSTRGQKGQRSRSGGRSGITKRSIKFTLRRVPKVRGFKSIYPKMSFINLDLLNKKFKEGDIVTPEKLVELKLVKLSPSGLKILGEGKLDKRLTVYAHKFSKTAENAIIKKGGRAILINR